MSGMRKRSSWLLTCLTLVAVSAQAQTVGETSLGSAVERQLSIEQPAAWARDPEQIKTEAGDRLEKRQVLTESFETVKLKNVIPPIHFESGVAKIPNNYVEALRFEFGASIHRVVSLDLSDAVFEPGTADMRLQWRPRLDLLLAELRKGRSVLRLSYLADVEDKQLVDRRLAAVAQTITDSWRAMNCCYELTIEREVYWLRGEPPKEPVERLRGAP